MVAVVAITIPVVVCGCPLGLLCNVQMSTMMGKDMGTMGLGGMCPLLCGVPPSGPSVESTGFVLGPPVVLFAFDPALKIRPVFHPPPFA